MYTSRQDLSSINGSRIVPKVSTPHLTGTIKELNNMIFQTIIIYQGYFMSNSILILYKTTSSLFLFNYKYITIVSNK